MPKQNILQREPDEEVLPEERVVLHQSDITSGFVDARMNKYDVIRRSTSRPGGTTHTKAHFNTSSGVLSIWDGSRWLTTTLT